jgi:hypothetical protein
MANSSAIRAGQAYVEASLDTAKMATGGTTANGILKGLGMNVLKLNGGLKDLGGLWQSIAGSFGLIGLVQTAIEAVKWIYDLASATSDFNRELERSTELAELLRSRTAARGAALVAGVKGGDLDGGGVINEQRRQMEGLSAQYESQKKLVADLEPTWLSLGQAGKDVWELEKKNLDDLNTRMKDQQDLLNRLEIAKRIAADAAKKRALEEQRRQEQQKEDSRLSAVGSIYGRFTSQALAADDELRGRSERSQVERELKQANASDPEREKVLAQFDLAKELEGRRDEQRAAKEFEDTMRDLTRQLVESDLPEWQRKLNAEVDRLGLSDPDKIAQLETMFRKVDEKNQQPDTAFGGNTSGTFSAMSAQIFGGTDNPMRTIADHTKKQTDLQEEMAESFSNIEDEMLKFGRTGDAPVWGG